MAKTKKCVKEAKNGRIPLYFWPKRKIDGRRPRMVGKLLIFFGDS